MENASTFLKHFDLLNVSHHLFFLDTIPENLHTFYWFVSCCRKNKNRYFRFFVSSIIHE